jgi:hypothetical protein
VGRPVDLVIDPLRGEKVAVELPLELRASPESTRSELGLPEWVDLGDPLIARAATLLASARRNAPGLHLAFLGGAAHRLRCAASNGPELGLRRELHDLDLACLHKELGDVRAFLLSLRDTEGSGFQVLETNGDRIFNATGEGRRLRFHFVAGPESGGVRLATLDLLADEFNFCHRFDLRPDLRDGSSPRGTLSPTLLLLAKLQYIQRIPGSDRARVAPDRILEPLGRRDIVIGPEEKDVRDVLALLAEFPVSDAPVAISPARIAALTCDDWGLWHTLSLNVARVGRSPVLAALPAELRRRVEERLSAVGAALTSVSPKRRLAFLGGPWFEEVDSVPAADVVVRPG